MTQRTHVAVGVIYNTAKNKVLISKRPDHLHLGGYWEFPGGKVEKNEDVYSALKRELFEELGIVIDKATALIEINHDYLDKHVLLDVWQVTSWKEEPVSCENQEIRWVTIEDLENYNFPEANKHIIQAITLNPYYLISKESYSDYSVLTSTVEDCFSRGLRLFQLRLNMREDKIFNDTVNKLAELANSYKAKFLLNGTAEDIDKYPIDGIHLKADKLTNYKSRPVAENYILGASCHNIEELIKAKELNVNYAFISPVLTTSSHPDAAPLGWEKFSELSQCVNFPVFALGGMKPSDLELSKSYGAHGIAMISSIWNSRLSGDCESLFK